MDALYAIGIQFSVVLQSVAWLELPMRFFAFLGTADFYFVILPVIYWCIDAGLGVRIGFILLFSRSVNEIVKLTLTGPRPYWISAQVKALAAEPSFGVPSGHAQLAVSIWGTVAAWARRTWVWIAAIAVIFLISLSRLYLGVHFPHDVLVGWLLGGLTLWAFVAFWDRLAGWVKRLTALQQALLILGVAAIALIKIGWLVYSLRGYVLPAEWVANAARAGGPTPPTISLEGTVTSAGAFIGLAFGLMWIGRHGGFQPSGPIWKRVISFLLGLAGVLILYLGLKLVLPADESLIGSVLRLLRYALIGVWISAGAPFIFWRLGLMTKPKVGHA